jgi:hypothetical protein
VPLVRFELTLDGFESVAGGGCLGNVFGETAGQDAFQDDDGSSLA